MKRRGGRTESNTYVADALLAAILVGVLAGCTAPTSSIHPEPTFKDGIGDKKSVAGNSCSRNEVCWDEELGGQPDYTCVSSRCVYMDGTQECDPGDDDDCLLGQACNYYGDDTGYACGEPGEGTEDSRVKLDTRKAGISNEIHSCDSNPECKKLGSYYTCAYHYCVRQTRDNLCDDPDDCIGRSCSPDGSGDGTSRCQ